MNKDNWIAAIRCGTKQGKYIAGCGYDTEYDWKNITEGWIISFDNGPVFIDKKGSISYPNICELRIIYK